MLHLLWIYSELSSIVIIEQDSARFPAIPLSHFPFRPGHLQAA